MPLRILAFRPPCNWTTVLVGRCMASRWNEACFLLPFFALFHDQWLAVALLVAIVGDPGLHVLRMLAHQRPQLSTVLCALPWNHRGSSVSGPRSS